MDDHSTTIKRLGVIRNKAALFSQQFLSIAFDRCFSRKEELPRMFSRANRISKELPVKELGGSRLLV